MNSKRQSVEKTVLDVRSSMLSLGSSLELLAFEVVNSERHFGAIGGALGSRGTKMVRSEKFLGASVLAGMTLAVVASGAVQFVAHARAAPGTARVDIAAERIGGAFASLQEIDIDSGIATTATRASKGDLAIRADCAAATWPNVDRSCLSKADGSPALYVRTITIGYQTGQNATVLLRVPGAVAERGLRISRPVSFQ